MRMRMTVQQHWRVGNVVMNVMVQPLSHVLNVIPDYATIVTH